MENHTAVRRRGRILLALCAVLALVVPASQVCGGELKPGDVAPDFVLQASDGRSYRLSDFRGRQPVVLVWFPRVDRLSSRLHIQLLTENFEEISKHDVALFMIGVDPLEAITAFAAKHKAPFPVLSDSTARTAEAFGVKVDYTRFGQGMLAQQWTFYVDKDGRIALIDKIVRPRYAPDDILSNLKALGVPKHNPGEK